VPTATAAEVGQSPTILTAAIPVATTAIAAAVVAQLCSYSTTVVGCHEATTTVSHQQLSMLQLWEDGALCLRMPPAQAKQLTVSSSTRGQSTEGPMEGSCTMDWPQQLHHRG
jgi:hypothetical protein